MIRIKKLVLKNFKSFKKAEIPISRGFTAIVGSNGSGKSNILDALLFVLGISSLKALRASRMTDLVNNQAQEDYAKVEISLEDDQKQKQWVISRTIDKQGRSVVRLDEKHVALNGVNSLLEELGISPTGHNIVVQGDIMRIIEMNAVQRREMIDEVAGIREFDEKREESFKELDKVDLKIKEVRIVLSERETYLQELSKEREAALQFNRLQEEFQRTKATLFKAELQELEKKLEQNRTRKGELEKERGEKSLKLEENRKELEQLEQKVEELNQQLIAASEKTYSGLGLLVEERRSEKKVREERKNGLTEALQKNNSRIGELKARNQQIETDLSQKKALLAEKDKIIQELESSVAKEKKEFEEKQGQWSAKSKELQELEGVWSGQVLSVNSQRQLFFEKQSLLRESKKSLEFRKQSLSEVSAEKKRLSERVAAKSEKKFLLDELLKKNAQPEESLREAEEKLRENQRKQAYLESQNDSLGESVRQLEKAVANCPTCDSKITKDQRERVLGMKQAELKKIGHEIESLRSEREKWTAQRENFEVVLKKKRELEFALADFKELSAKEAELEQKERKLKLEVEESPVGKISSELEAVEKQLQSLERESKKTEDQISDFKQQYGLEAIARPSKTLEQLSRKINEEKGLRKSLELEISLVLKEETVSNDRGIQGLGTENDSIQQRLEAEETEIKRIQKELEKLEVDLAKAESATKEVAQQKQRQTEKIATQKQQILKTEAKIREMELSMNQLEIDNSKLGVRQSDLAEESKEFAEIPMLESFDIRQLRERLPQIEKETKKMGAINQKAVEHFGEFEQELLEVKRKSDKLEEERLAVLDMIKKIEDRRTQVFMDCFNGISRNFNEIFFMLADGQGKLSLSNPEQPLESGLMIEASVKGKAIHSMDSMSGGEKTLTGLAFLFAIQMHNPAPFYVFDEADAALDKENSMKLARIVAKISQGSQFIGITHNDTMVREADQIVGVALNEQKSSVIGLKLKEPEKAA